ncbi:hypothetical protein PC116_g3612 [Phytophthora cactorum]|uniref:Uncharacterized protein n=1 Tax=Phytophthora cactorum TaxID=29920 RepID=A0A8T1GCS0_9STRA|nr:hypothetical protein PC114_g1981 [Phytophthora cactorum]KAG2993607.1 hypothetical protein PC118_g3912 [Phytophthora cactorum]KAG3038659.1 hypothetical protein PC119_g2729 [Phytophthora cactorum]KAG3102861.1 hypothetical protein PC122_g2093 [Phytophthora cactorum]KAG3191047.1 hypothetical protein C6341_g1370 [Phytophthora cactorum]
MHNARRAADGWRKHSHVKFLKQLHLELCQLNPEDWEALLNNDTVQGTPSKPRAGQQSAGNERVENDEWRPGNNQTGRKRHSSTYCSDCKLTTSSKRPKAWRVFLCDKARREHNGIPITCLDLWHKVWRNGSMLPNTGRKRKIRARTPATPTEGNGDSASSSDRSSEGEESAEEAAVEGSNQPKRPRVAETAD